MTEGRERGAGAADAALDQPDRLDCGTDAVVLTRSGSVATLRLNRPRALNAMNQAVLDGVDRALDELERQPGLAVLVLTGTGRGFCAGGDLRDSPAAGVRTAEEDEVRLRRVATTTERLRGLPQVTLAAVNGSCAGGGLAWAAACDLRLATAEAVFTTAYLDVGLPGDLGGAWLLTRLVGPGRALDWYLWPRRISSAEAVAAGFLAAAVPPADFVAAVQGLVARWAAAPPAALRAVKANARDATHLDLDAYLDHETRRHVAVRHRSGG